jgi:excisionase family DNA binding protein
MSDGGTGLEEADPPWAEDGYGPEMYESYDACDLANVLGVHRRTVARWIAKGRLPGYRLGAVGSRLRFRMVDLDRALFRAIIREDGWFLKACGRACARLTG